MCDPDIQSTVDAMMSSIRSGGSRQMQQQGYGQPNQCMQQCQQQCQNGQTEIENEEPFGGGQGQGQGQGQMRSEVLTVEIARGAHSSGDPIHVFLDNNFAGTLKGNDGILHGGQSYQLTLQPSSGPGNVLVQASSTNGVHIGEIKYGRDVVAKNIWIDEDRDPKYRYCPCDRYDPQCRDSQRFKAIQFGAQTKQINSAVCSGNGQNDQNSQNQGQNQNQRPNQGQRGGFGGQYGQNGQLDFGQKSWDQYGGRG